MQLNVTQKLIKAHLVSGDMIPGTEIGLKIDQTLSQDATGTMVMLELEAMKLDRVKTEVSAQYVDHILIQIDHEKSDDHLFLQSATRRLGFYYSRPGNGVNHPIHMQRLAKPGKTLLLGQIVTHAPMGVWGCSQWALVVLMWQWLLQASLFM